jgi:large subunit ribosomal protein L17
MCGALFAHGRIQTTEAKAKELRPIAEKLITLARKDPTDVAAQRHAVAFLRSKDAVHDLFHQVGPRFTERPGGYTRIVKLGVRAGDAASMSLIELTGTSESVEPAKKRRQKRAKADASTQQKGARAAAG